MARPRTITRTFGGPGWGISGGPVGSGATMMVCVTWSVVVKVAIEVWTAVVVDILVVVSIAVVTSNMVENAVETAVVVVAEMKVMGAVVICVTV